MTAIPGGTPSGRDLQVHELRELAARIAADPPRWRPLVRADTSARHFEQLWRDDHVDVWVITWASGNDTGFHDHDLSRGAVCVVEGEIVEERLVVGGPSRRPPRPAPAAPPPGAPPLRPHAHADPAPPPPPPAPPPPLPPPGP